MGFKMPIGAYRQSTVLLFTVKLLLFVEVVEIQRQKAKKGRKNVAMLLDENEESLLSLEATTSLKPDLWTQRAAWFSHSFNESW